MTEPRYQAYGLQIASELPLPELLRSESDDRPDVRISLGPVPDNLDDPLDTGVLFDASPSQFLLRMPAIAKYLVRNGDEIVIEPAPEATEHEVRVFMLGSCVGALLHQREFLVMHAAAIADDDGAVLFAGASGVGKSTLLGELLNRGHAMVVDDVCAVTTSDVGNATVMPGYPRTRLWADAAKKLDVDTEDLERTRPSIEKFERQVPDQFWNAPARFRRLYILGVHNQPDISVERLPALNSFSVVLHNTYRGKFIEGLAMRSTHFALATLVASSVTISRVKRPAAGFDLAELADAIEADLETS